MTTVIKSHKNGDYYVSLEITKYNIYVVQVCPQFDDYNCGYPIREMTYPMSEKKNACATYRRYIQKYCQ